MENVAQIENGEKQMFKTTSRNAQRRTSGLSFKAANKRAMQREIDRIGAAGLALQTFDDGCTLYRHFNADGALLYVGISVNALSRLGEHRQSSEWYKQIVKVTLEHFPSRKEAEEAETKAIKSEKPKFNVRGV